MIFSGNAVDTFKEKMPHPILTKIRGEPDYTSLKRLRTEIKANASAIHTTLAGGLHGHLGMVLTPLAYARISPTHPWIPPVHPGNMAVVPDGTTAHVANHLRDTFNTNLNFFTTADTVKKIIFSQIKNAIDEDYIAPEIDSITGNFTNDIPTTLDNLFDEYGSIKPDFIDDKISAFKAKHYDPAIPFASSFKTLEEIVEIQNTNNVRTGYSMLISRFSEYLLRRYFFLPLASMVDPSECVPWKWAQNASSFLLDRTEREPSLGDIVSLIKTIAYPGNRSNHYIVMLRHAACRLSIDFKQMLSYDFVNKLCRLRDYRNCVMHAGDPSVDDHKFATQFIFGGSSLARGEFVSCLLAAGQVSN